MLKAFSGGRNKRTEDHLFAKCFRTWLINSSKEVVSSWDLLCLSLMKPKISKP
jgi:hypothetical protein